MRNDTEMMNLILQIADSIEVEAIALSGSRTNPQGPKDEFQDYDVVYIVDDLEDLISDLSWLDQYGNRLIEQHNRLGHRRLYLMLFEDGNRIDLTLCPKAVSYTHLDVYKRQLHPSFDSALRCCLWSWLCRRVSG